MRFCFNFLTIALVTQSVVGNQEKKMLCYTVAIDNFPPQIFQLPPADDSRVLDLRQFYLILSLLLVAVLLRWRVVKMLKTDSDRRLTSLLDNPVIG